MGEIPSREDFMEVCSALRLFARDRDISRAGSSWQGWRVMEWLESDAIRELEQRAEKAERERNELSETCRDAYSCLLESGWWYNGNKGKDLPSKPEVDQLRADLERVTTERDTWIRSAWRACESIVITPDVNEPNPGSLVELRSLCELRGNRISKLEACQAVCHCGDLVIEHDQGSGHSPVEMPVGPCPDNERLNNRVAELEAEVKRLRVKTDGDKAREAMKGLVRAEADARDVAEADLAAARERIFELEQEVAHLHGVMDGAPESIEGMIRKHGLALPSDEERRERIDRETGKRVAEEAADE